MSRATASLLGVAALLLIGSPIARADQDAEDPAATTTSRRPATPEGGLFPDAFGHNALALNVGLGSAVGLAGATYALGAGPAEIEVGLGYGFSGWQTSGMVKLAIYGTPTVRITTGAGLGFTSGAAFSTKPTNDGGDRSGNPIWLNLDLVGFEYRSPSHFYASGGGGLTRGLGHGTFEIKVANTCGSDECWQDMVSAGWLPQFRGAIGVWF